MYYSSTTGQTIYNEHEQRDANIADDDIKTMLNLKDRLNDIFESIETMRKCGTLKLSEREINTVGIAMHELLDELLHDDYVRCQEISASIFNPDRISEYRVPTNPNTYKTKGEPL